VACLEVFNQSFEVFIPDLGSWLGMGRSASISAWLSSDRPSASFNWITSGFSERLCHHFGWNAQEGRFSGRSWHHPFYLYFRTTWPFRISMD
jgi:hypothetical protein